MKVGYHGVDDPKIETGLYEKIGLRCARGNVVSFEGCGLEGAYDRGAGGYYAPFLFPRARDRTRGLGRNHKRFGMHGMSIQPALDDRAERSDADIEHDARELDPAGLEVGENILREMQRRSRRGNAAGNAREDRLIAPGMRESRLADVRRQRYLAVPFEELADGKARFESHDACAALGLRFDRHRCLVTDADRAARKQLSSGPNEREPARRIAVETQIVSRMKQQELRTAATGNAASAQSRSDHGRLVEDQQVARSQKRRKLLERAVVDAAIRIQREQPGCVAALRGGARNQLRR